MTERSRLQSGELAPRSRKPRSDYGNYNREGHYVLDGNYNHDKNFNRGNYGNRNDRSGLYVPSQKREVVHRDGRGSMS